jgi:Ca-activated chloride channel family protein
MSRKVWAFIAVWSVLISLPALMLARAGRGQKTQTNSADKPSPNQTLKVDVDLTLVNATVTDPLNRYVSGLEQEHFQVWEDKIEQKIAYFSSEDVPLSLGMIFDVSGSMKDKI